MNNSKPVICRCCQLEYPKDPPGDTYTEIRTHYHPDFPKGVRYICDISLQKYDEQRKVGS